MTASSSVKIGVLSPSDADALAATADRSEGLRSQDFGQRSTHSKHRHHDRHGSRSRSHPRSGGTASRSNGKLEVLTEHDNGQQMTSANSDNSQFKAAFGHTSDTGHHSKKAKSDMKQSASKEWRRMMSSGTMDLKWFPRNGAAWSQWLQILRRRCNKLCDTWHWNVLTTVLTIYALFGDDFRLAVTPQRTDPLFDALTMLCILVFTADILISSLGREEYFLGFFFALDLISTVTLVFDFTWTVEALFCDNASDSSALSQNSQTAKTGLRASRTVRILRLVRLVKLYRAYSAAMERKEQVKRAAAEADRRRQLQPPGEEAKVEEETIEVGETDEDAVKPSDEQQTSEMRVGKKLSDMTTRRVIGLVLVMLFGLPYFEYGSWGLDEFRYSAYMGLEFVYNSWRQWCSSFPAAASGDWTFPCLSPDFDAEAESAGGNSMARKFYEEHLLSYIYYHHDATVGATMWRLHWMGLKSTMLERALGSQSLAEDALGQIARLSQAVYLGSPVSLPASSWDQKFSGGGSWDVDIRPLPDQVKDLLQGKWEGRCQGFVGASIAESESLQTEDSSVCTVTEDLRCTEVEYLVPFTKSQQEKDELQILAAFDARGWTQLEAGLNILQTVFICIVVGLGAMTFSNDANQLLLHPIQRMIAKMETIKDNPVEAMKLGDLEYRREQIEHTLKQEELAKKGRLWRWLFMHTLLRKAKEPMETVILERTIIKLGGLLALGFGEAGAEIIGANMRGGSTSGVHAMVPGQKVDAIICFCSIQHFTHATEVLKEKVMVFVNQVGEIVHGCVDDYNGSPNMNNGEAFLLVWRIGSPTRRMKLADMAIMSLVKMILAINTSPVLAQYREHPGMQQRVQDYRVQVVFGLHCGWAIEGAIGSEFKIDASYLSPNVNMSSRLAHAAGTFGVLLLISHFMINICSQEMAAFCRHIDNAVVAGLGTVIKLFTLDLDWEKLPVKDALGADTMVVKNRWRLRQIREARKNEKWAEDCKIWDAFSSDPLLVTARQDFSEEFFDRFKMALRNYEAGEWLVARDMLLTCHPTPRIRYVDSNTHEDESKWPSDGPTRTLLHFMRSTEYKPPAGWKGHRELVEK